LAGRALVAHKLVAVAAVRVLRALTHPEQPEELVV
jgi:hypothetical protein